MQFMHGIVPHPLPYKTNPNNKIGPKFGWDMGIIMRVIEKCFGSNLNNSAFVAFVMKMA